MRTSRQYRSSERAARGGLRPVRALVVAALLAGLALAAAAAPSAAAATSSPAAGDATTPAAAVSLAPAAAYHIGTTQAFDGLNPFSARSAVSWECFRVGYDFLTWYDDEYRPAPDIATGWKVSEDGRIWTFSIREGMEWQDGVPLTARDVAFTWNLVLDTETPAFSGYLAGVVAVQAPDDLTVVVTCRRPKADLLGVPVPILPEHIWGTVDPGQLDRFSNLPFVGSGPFRVAGVQGGAQVELEPNPVYPVALGGAPALAGLTFVTGDDSSLLADYEAGRLDAVAGISPDLRAAYEAFPGTTAVAGPAIGYEELGFNCRRSRRNTGAPVLRDPSVRRAIALAIDTRQLVRTATAGLAEPGTSLLSPAQADWRWDVPVEAQYRYDPLLAKRILDDAGYADRDGDGVREDRAGRRLRFRLAVLAESVPDQEAARLVAGWCRDVGVELSTEAMSGASLDAAVRAGDFDLVIRGRGGDVDPGSLLGAFTATPVAGSSDTGYANAEYDRLYARQSRALDPADTGDITRRKVLIDALQKLLYRDQPCIVLWYGVDLQAFRSDRWAGYVPAPGAKGAPFFNRLRGTYLSLRRMRVAEPAPKASRAWVWGLLGGGIAAAAVGFAVLRRQPQAQSPDTTSADTTERRDPG